MKRSSAQAVRVPTRHRATGTCATRQLCAHRPGGDTGTNLTGPLLLLLLLLRQRAGQQTGAVTTPAALSLCAFAAASPGMRGVWRRPWREAGLGIVSDGTEKHTLTCLRGPFEAQKLATERADACQQTARADQHRIELEALSSCCR